MTNHPATSTRPKRDEPDQPPEAPPALRAHHRDAPIPDARVDRLPSCRCPRRRRLRRAGAFVLTSHSSGRRVVADDVELGHELDAGGLRHPSLHLGDELAHVTRGGAGLGLEEVGVLLGDDRAADAQTLQPRRLDEPARAVARRVAEHGAGVLAAGLVLASPAHDLVDPASQAAGSSGSRRTRPRSRRRSAAGSSGGSRARGRPRPGARRGDRPPRRGGRSPTPAAAPRRSRGRARPRSCAPRRRPTRGSRRRTPARPARRPPRGGRARGAAPPRRPGATGVGAAPEVIAQGGRSPRSRPRARRPARRTRRRTSSRFEPRPITSSARPVPSRDGRDRCEARRRPDAHEHGDRAADAVRAQLGERHALGSSRPASRSRSSPASDARSTRTRSRRGPRSHSSGTVVRSPAPSVSTTSPGRASRSACCTTSARRGR